MNQFKKQFADTVPKPVNFVSDYDDLLNPSQEDSLNILAADADKKGIAQIAVVTFTGSMVRKETLDSLSLKIAKEWGVGHKDTNNGIFIGICKDCKRISIRNGLGIEKTLTDSATKVILDKYILPPFKQGQYFKGVWDGTKALLDKLK